MSGYKVYSSLADHKTYFEIWGGSTKHPDVVYCFSDYVLSEWFEPEEQTFGWLFECASKLNIPYHSYALAKWACKMYEQSRGWFDE